MINHVAINTIQLREIKELAEERFEVQFKLKQLTDKKLADLFGVSPDTIRVAVGVSDYREYKNKGTRTRRGFRHLARSQLVKLHNVYSEKIKLLKRSDELNNENIGKMYGVSRALIQKAIKQHKDLNHEEFVKMGERLSSRKGHYIRASKDDWNPSLRQPTFWK